MARLVEYDSAGIVNHSNDRDLRQAVSCMQRLLELPNYEISHTEKSFAFRVFEKSFWGKVKLKAYCEVTVIDDLKLDVSIIAGVEDIPPYHNVGVSFTLWSDNMFDGYIRELIGEDRKIILSYYWLMEFVNAWVENIKGGQIDANDAVVNSEMLSGLNNMEKLVKIKIIQGRLKSLKY